MDETFASQFAEDWIKAWNTHDLDHILSHYAEEFTMSSPAIVQIAREPSGTLKGKTAVGAYWRKALEMLPDLRFEWVETYVGVDSLIIAYKGVNGRPAAEFFLFNAERLVIKSIAHYGP